MQIHNDIIRSRQNPTVKWAASLSEKKYREQFCTFIAEGEKLTLEAAAAALDVTHIFVMESKADKLVPQLCEAFSDKKYDECKLILLADDIFSKISTEKAPQGVISAIKYLDFFRELDIINKEDFFLKPCERAIALCSVRDPGNLGSVIRSAVAFGVDHIILTDDSADLYNPKTVRSAMGSLFRVKSTRINNFASFIDGAQKAGRRVYAAELTDSAVSLDEVNLCCEDIFVIGNEGHGITAEISDKCSASVYIPISKKTESLNAAVAAAVFMWEQGKRN